MPRFNDGAVYTRLQKDDIVLMGDPSVYGEILAQNLLVEDVTRAELQTLISGTNLVRGKHYRITNAAGATLSLLVTALTDSVLSEYAYNTANGETYKYDITADTAVLEPNPIALGTANQLLGVNAGGTAQEYKTLLGTNNQVTVTHGVGGIQIGFPSYVAIVNNYDEFLIANADSSIKEVIFSAIEINLGENTLNLNSNKNYKFNNTVITHEDITKNIISATNLENFSISGRLTIVGTKITNETNQLESGLYLKNCKNYFIDGVVITDCRFCGIEIGPPDEYLPTDRGDRGKFSNISLNNNNYPIYIAPLAEYNVFTNITASSNLNAFLVQGGNNNFSVCNIVDNQKGVWILGGANDAHGVFSGCNINHNTEYNLFVENILNGETFVGCHFYGDDAESSGMIKIKNSRGVNIQSGIIDAAIIIETGEDGRCHSISNNFIAGSYTSISGDFLENIIRKNNFTTSGQWASNN